MTSPQSAPDAGSWTFLTNHAHVLLTLHQNPDLRQRDIAAIVGITEGGVQRILGDLQEGGYLAVDRIGRRNHYVVHTSAALRHPLNQGHTVGELLDGLTGRPHRRAARAS